MAPLPSIVEGTAAIVKIKEANTSVSKSEFLGLAFQRKKAARNFAVAGRSILNRLRPIG